MPRAQMQALSNQISRVALDALGRSADYLLEMINAEAQLLFSSDWPHFDFKLPAVIHGLPFLSEQAKRNILGSNAARIFHLNPKSRKKL
jgi:predicted TIM-barrel fold metal-dependent hydrolase